MPAESDWLLRWAQRAGEQALPIFIVTLALLLVSVATASWAWRHPRLQPLRRRRDAAPPWVQLGLSLVAGFAVIVGAAELFAEIAEEIGAEGALGRADQVLTDALQASVADAAVQIFARVTHLGDTVTLTVLCVMVALALLATRRWALAFGWVMAVAGNGLLNVTLKQVFARVRPVHTDGVVLAEGYSFPSGHSSGSLVAYGMLAYLALRLLPPRWHLPVVLAATALAFTVASSRVFLRVHFASDVLAGLASGAAWLAICIASIEVTRWWQARAPSAPR